MQTVETLQAIADALKLRNDGFQQLPFQPRVAVFTRYTDGMTVYMPPDCTVDDVAARYHAKDKEACELCGKVHSGQWVCISCLSVPVESSGDICPNCKNFAASHGGN